VKSLIYIQPKIQILQKSNKRIRVARGGRSSGKSFGVATLLILYALQNAKSKILCLKSTQNSLADSALSILKRVIDTYNLNAFFTQTKYGLECRNGSVFLFKGCQFPERLKSIDGINVAWIEEGQEFTQEALDIIFPTIREEGSHIYITYNPKYEDDPIHKLANLDSDQIIVETINYPDNPFLSQVTKQEIQEDLENNPLKHNHIWLGECIQDIDGALWRRELISYIPKEKLSDLILNETWLMDKIVVALDPSTTANQNSDACGLVVAGQKDSDYFILDDSSAVMTPQEWAQKAVALYHYYKADGIVAEGNQGGQMISTVINQIDPSIRVRIVHASRGKILRAEPILQLYEQGRVYHRKCFSQLETEMLTYTGDPKQKSPNSLDAMVWGLTDLSQINRVVKGAIRGSMHTMRIRN
jgi:phage terminase large subunit-like protein